MDGFGVYAYQDIDGATPVVDECGGHFGPVDETGKVLYHYHRYIFESFYTSTYILQSY